jgi:hypothetical protein
MMHAWMLGVFSKQKMGVQPSALAVAAYLRNKSIELCSPWKHSKFCHSPSLCSSFFGELHETWGQASSEEDGWLRLLVHIEKRSEMAVFGSLKPRGFSQA